MAKLVLSYWGVAAKLREDIAGIFCGDIYQQVRRVVEGGNFMILFITQTYIYIYTNIYIYIYICIYVLVATHF